MIGNLSTLEVADFLRDGLEDVFVGARAVPGNYGLKPKSLFVAKQGRAVARRNARTPAQHWYGDGCGLETPTGMAGKTWSLPGNGMPVQIFQNNKGVLREGSAIENSAGWWQRVAAADLDHIWIWSWAIGG